MVRRPYLKEEWCVYAIENPVRIERQPDGRFRFWSQIQELEGRYIRVITESDRVTVVNAFPDRNFVP